MNPVTTTALGLSVSQVADIIQWLCTRPLPPPPNNVTMALAAFLVGAGHFVVTAFKAYFPPKGVTAPAPQIQQAPPQIVRVPAQ